MPFTKLFLGFAVKLSIWSCVQNSIQFALGNENISYVAADMH